VKTKLLLVVLVVGLGRMAWADGRIGVVRDAALGGQELAGKVGGPLGATYLSAEDLCDAAVLSPSRFDVVIYTPGKTYPAPALDVIGKYLLDGGNMIVLGGPAFSVPCVKIGGQWRAQTRASVNREIVDLPAATNRLFDFENGKGADGWKFYISEPNNDCRIAIEHDPAQGDCLAARIVNLKDWASWHHDINVPAGHSFLSFWAKGDGKTPEVGLELDEADGSHWLTTVPITAQGRRYVVTAKDFVYWGGGKGRGGYGDYLRLDQARDFGFGLAKGGPKATVTPGSYTLWIDDIGTGASLANDAVVRKEVAPLVVDGLSPEYKFFPMRGMKTVGFADEVAGDGRLPGVAEFADAFSCPTRVGGLGIGKDRPKRFVPIIKAYDREGRGCGFVGWMHVNHNGKLRNAWAGFGADEAAMAEPAMVKAVVALARRMVDGVYLYAGGTDQFAYWPGETVKLGAMVVDYGKAGQGRKDGGEHPQPPQVLHSAHPAPFRMTDKGHFQGTMTVEVSVTGKGSPKILFSKRMDVEVAGGEDQSVTCEWRPPDGPREYRVTVRLLRGGKVVDIIAHDFRVWRPKPEAERSYLTAHDGCFWLKGRRWGMHGVNYWPSNSNADEDWDEYNFPLRIKNYDPEIVEGDLARIQAIGFNMVHVQYNAPGDLNAPRNLVDLLARCEAHGLKVDLFVDANPMNTTQEKLDAVRDLIRTARLPENDTLMSYDVSWETAWGTYEPSSVNGLGRKAYDRDWERWIVEQYGSVESAERDWKYKCPRNDKGEVSGVPDKMLGRREALRSDAPQGDGEWRVMVAAYYRFLDDLLSKRNTIVARWIKETDPRHFVSFRMTYNGDYAGYYGPEMMRYDFRGFRSLDMICPEKYTKPGDWEALKTSIFTGTYERFAAPGKPLIFKEFGYSLWSGSNFGDQSVKREEQGKALDDFYRMMTLSVCQGGSVWWYPSGFRIWEGSDYGITDPDGSWRPSTAVIAKWAKTFTGGQDVPKVTHWITVDRDADCRGYFGEYERIQKEYWDATARGEFVGLRSPGTGTTSVDAPLVAVGNVPYTGENPPKYLNAEFTYVKVRDADGQWVEVKDGDVIEVARGEDVRAKAAVGNTGDAEWVCPASAGGKPGGVYLGVVGSGDMMQAIPRKVAYFGEVEVPEFVVARKVEGAVKVEVRMTALGRAWFGEKVGFTVRAR
jgi:hypothetical protein